MKSLQENCCYGHLIEKDCTGTERIRGGLEIARQIGRTGGPPFCWVTQQAGRRKSHRHARGAKASLPISLPSTSPTTISSLRRLRPSRTRIRPPRRPGQQCGHQRPRRRPCPHRLPRRGRARPAHKLPRRPCGHPGHAAAVAQGALPAHTSTSPAALAACPEWRSVTRPPPPKLIGYSASKAALNMLTVQLAYLLRDTIKVNSADPGYTATDLNSHRGLQTIPEGAANPSASAYYPMTAPPVPIPTAKASSPW